MPDSEQRIAGMISLEQARDAITAGRLLWLAADESLLRQLPTGQWVGGSIPYFMSEQGGKTTREEIFASELDPEMMQGMECRFYDEQTVHEVARDAPENGFSLILIPAQSKVHLEYAQNAPDYEDMFLKPIAGWVTGVHLDDLGRCRPCVVNGQSGEVSYDKALVMHVALKPDRVAHVGIVNTLTQGGGDEFEFMETGFIAQRCRINGVDQNLADYLTENQVDTRLPLVADYSGAMINVSFQGINEADHSVSFYAPIFTGVKYRLAAPIDDYVKAFRSAIPEFSNGVTFSCNCVLNYLYSELEGKKTGSVIGPMTFGEIAYQLLNQTMVYVTVESV